LRKFYFLILFSILSATGVALTGCASYQSQIGSFDSEIRAHRPADAAKALEAKANKDGDDQIVFLFEYATALQMANQFKESNKAFLRAEDLTDIKDYHSLSRITGSLLLNEGMVQYKGEDYEKVMINAMAAINFLMEHDFENAMVEARRLNDKLYKYKFEAKRNYEQNPFAYYLTALLWEESRDWDSAYIQFQKAYELNPNVSYLQEDLLRGAKNAHRDEDFAKWKKQFPNVMVPDQKGTGEIVLIYQQGWAPKKEPNPSFPRIPKLFPVHSSTVAAHLEIEKGPEEKTETVFSVQETSIKELDDQYAGLIAKRAAGIATKALVAEQIRQHNQALGTLAFLALNAADKADLRQWSSLPATFQVAKLRLKPGRYKVRIVGVNSSDRPSGEEMPWQEIEVQARRKVFLNWRSVL
jgi:uncharacterized protein